MTPNAPKNFFAEFDSEDLQEDLNSLYNWSLDNNLHFGIPKCVLLTNQKHQIYHLGSFPIASVTTHRDQGVTVSSNLSWETHYDQILHHWGTQELRTATMYLSNLFISTYKLYLTLVRVKLKYCSQIWHPYLLKDITTFERLQRRAKKFTTLMIISNV